MGVSSKTANPTYNAIISMRNILALVILVILAIYGYADAQGPPPPPRRPGRPGRPTRPLRFDGQLRGFGGAGAGQRPLYGPDANGNCKDVTDVEQRQTGTVLDDACSQTCFNSSFPNDADRCSAEYNSTTQALEFVECMLDASANTGCTSCLCGWCHFYVHIAKYTVQYAIILLYCKLFEICNSIAHCICNTYCIFLKKVQYILHIAKNHIGHDSESIHIQYFGFVFHLLQLFC